MISNHFRMFFSSLGEVAQVGKDSLDVGLFKRKLDYGTYVKLYDYYLPRPSDITLDLWRDLNQFLYHPPLPVPVYEKRFTGAHTPTKPMLGNRNRILIDEKKRSVKDIISLNFSTNKLRSVSCEAVVFNPDIKNREFIDKKSVVLTRNGQVHGYFDRSYITQEVKLTYLKDSLLVHVSCDNIPQNIREDIFMPSRDRYRESDATKELWATLAKELHQNELLKRLNEERMNQLIYENKGDQDYLEKIMKKIVQKDNSLLKLLNLKGNIDFKQFDGKKKKQKENEKEVKETFKGKRFPSIFRIKNGSNNDTKTKGIPLGGEGIIHFETDVENEYLIRPVDKGEFILQILQSGSGGDGGITPFPVNVSEMFEVSRVGPYEGSIKLRLKPLEKIAVGNETKFSAKLTSPDGDKECIFQVKIGPKKEKESRPVEQNTDYSLPQIIHVFKEANPDVPSSKTWDDPEFNWTGEDVTKLYPSSSEKSLIDAVAVNMDSFSLSQYIRSNKLTGNRVDAVKRIYEVGIFLTSIFLYSEVKKSQQEWKIVEPEEVVSNLMRGYSKVILYLLLNEQLLKEVEENI